jgi:NADPH-dependent glutamate synthase beta subunit-like oxidoreductase/glutamate synthase domain-containing protein 3/Pyruvate/2-oxoacid:ferredoxin oxidoreductase delta subunit
MENVTTRCTIQVGTAHYRDLNTAIRRKIEEGVRHFTLEGVTGQRYIGSGLEHGVVIEINGVPGQDLGVFNGGSKIVVHGNAQDGVGNTMNDGFIVVHGSVGDIPGHMVRNGKIYIRGSAGFRAGIMMKEYMERHPVMIVGETIGDYVGEYMAGGTIVVLGYSFERGESPVSNHVASGIFGGQIYIRGSVSKEQLGKGAMLAEAGKEDIDRILPHLAEYCDIFDMDIHRILDAPISVIRRAGGRPYGDLYVPSSSITRELKPVHRNARPPCADACPVGIPNPVIIRKLKEGRVLEAFEVIDDYTPFRYSCCGMVCPGLCRVACTRNSLGEAVKIDEIARTYHPAGEVRVLEEPKRERIGVIGAGPSGLSAAWHLARRGYKVDVFDREGDIGGKLTHSIPDSRLSKEDVRRDLRRIESLGISFHTNTEVDAALFEKIRRDHDALVLAVGAQQPRVLGFEGEEKAVSSYAFLRSLKMGGGNPPAGSSGGHGGPSGVPAGKPFVEARLAGKSVVVVGAGNVAMDVACECFGLGASSVTAIDVQKPAAFGKELERAKELGTRILFPRFVEKYGDGELLLKGGERLAADLLVEAVGELPELRFAGEDFVFSREDFTTSLPGVYVIGDMVVPGLLTHSIGMGRKVADSIHRAMRGLPPPEDLGGVVDKKRVNVVYFGGEEGVTNSLEACFSCGTCVQCDICVENCPRGAIRRTGENFSINTEICSGCGVCASVCPRGAIAMEPL